METIFTNFNLWIIIKVLVLILLAMYLVFATVIIKQVNLMTKTLQLGFEAPIKLLSYFHLVFAVLVFLTALFTL